MGEDLVVRFIREYLSRDRWADTLLTDICDYMLGGHLVVRYGHVPKTLDPVDELRFTPASIDWAIEWPPITNTAQLYLHSLEPVKTLIQGFEVTGDRALIDLAVDITRSWFTYADTDAASRFTWYDHAASDRTVYLIYLRETILEHQLGHDDFLAETEKALVRHGEFLADPGNYTPQNHGTMMDRALYLASRYLADHPQAETWRTTAVTRLREAVARDYSPQMVNLENSSSYHLYNFDLFVTLEKSLLNPFGDTLGDEFSDSIRAALGFLVHLSKPDHAFPMLGDGSRATLDKFPTHPSYAHVRHHPHLRHVLSNGRRGKAPRRLFATYSDDGYAFMRTSWDYANERDRITYASFRAGRRINNHKHADDLSFTLYANGRDIFVDSGTYTYQPGEFRNYFLSAMAHNTIVVDGHTYPVVHGTIEDTAITDTAARDGYFHVAGRNDAYPGVRLTRRFYFLRRSGRVVIVDDATSDEEHTYSQVFHLSHRLDTTTLRVTPDGSTALDLDDIRVRLTQLQPCDTVVHRGDTSDPTFGIVSEGFNHLEETTTLEYQQTGRRARFVTTVTVDPTLDTAPFAAKLTRRGLRLVDGSTKHTLEL